MYYYVKMYNNFKSESEEIIMLNPLDLLVFVFLLLSAFTIVSYYLCFWLKNL